MRRYLLPVLLASLLVIAGCDNDPAPKVDGKTASATKARDEAAIAVIETDSYVMKVHRAIPFTSTSDPLGMLKVKQGHHFVVLDMSVKSKSTQPLEMGSIMLATKITDESGKSYEGNLGALTAYMVQNPDPNHDSAYEAVWSMEFGPGEFHRAIALGVEVPADVKTFVLAAPVKPGDAHTRQARFSP